MGVGERHCAGSHRAPVSRRRFDGSAACGECQQFVHLNRDGVVALHRPPVGAVGHR